MVLLYSAVVLAVIAVNVVIAALAANIAKRRMHHSAVRARSVLRLRVPSAALPGPLAVGELPASIKTASCCP